MKRIAIVTLALGAFAVGVATAGPDGHDEHGHSHEESKLAFPKAIVGPWTVSVTVSGALEAGKEAHADFTVTGGEAMPKALRAWIGSESAEETGKARVDLSAKGTAHGHLDVPKPLKPEHRLWIEVESGGKRQRSSVALPGSHAHDHGEEHGHAHHSGGELSLAVAAAGEGRLAVSLKDMSGKALGATDLTRAHEELIHLLAIDPSLTDFHHLHPLPDANGAWTVAFVPKGAGEYRFFAEATPQATGRSSTASTSFTVAGNAAAVNEKASSTATVDGLTFELIWNAPAKSGAEATFTVAIKNADGAPAALDSFMGSDAHFVAFPKDRSEAFHGHAADGAAKVPGVVRGSMTFEEPGFHALFVQVKVGGKERTARFGVLVEKGATKGHDHEHDHDHDHGHAH